MSEKTPPPLRVHLTTLPPREERASGQMIQKILKRVAGPAGAPCVRTCDCAFGLVCTDGLCTEEW